jgi:hypothetical protein
MAFPTVTQILADVITTIGQVGGSSVQTYTEPQAKLGINRIFEQLYWKYDWPHLWSWERRTLDATTGLITAAIDGVENYTDIARVTVADSSQEIPLSSGTQHLATTGSRAMYRVPLTWEHEDFNTKFFKFYPLTSSGELDFFCGHRPAEFSGGDDVIPMEKTLMVLGVSWWLLADDGMNPASAEKAQILYDGAYTDIIGRLNKGPVGYGSTGRGPSRYVTIR